MTKELEALNELRENLDFEGCLDFINEKRITDIKQALQRLEAIDNANPSQALECLNKIVESFNETTAGMYGLGEVVVANDLIYGFKKELDTIKQALIKLQEQEKVLEIIRKKKVNVYDEIMCCKNYNEYLECDNIAIYKLTKEEFDLLKRWVE